MQKLNLPFYSIPTKIIKQNKYIFDIIRKKYVILSEEEWVRQSFLHYLINQFDYPKNLINIELALKINNLDKRADIVIFNRNGTPVLVVECKAPHIKISQAVFDQISIYNIELKVKYLIVTNGLNHYCCKFDFTSNRFEFINSFPSYAELMDT